MRSKMMLMAGLLVAALFAAPAPAQAGYPCDDFGACGDFYHYSPDDGFDDPIPTTCNWNTQVIHYRVPEGGWSGCHDTDGFFVAINRTVSCKFGVAWVKWYGPQWVKIRDTDNVQCVHGLP